MGQRDTCRRPIIGCHLPTCRGEPQRHTLHTQDPETDMGEMGQDPLFLTELYLDPPDRQAVGPTPTQLVGGGRGVGQGPRVGVESFPSGAGRVKVSLRETRSILSHHHHHHHRLHPFGCGVGECSHFSRRRGRDPGGVDVLHKRGPGSFPPPRRPCEILLHCSTPTPSSTSLGNGSVTRGVISQLSGGGE